MVGFALVFPGQGSQVVGMGRDLSDSSAAARLVFEEADAVLGYPLSRLCFCGPGDVLLQTEHAQPALLTAGVAAFAALRASIGQSAPIAVAGHSLGEFTALVAADALSFPDALRLVAERGRLMGMAGEATPGTMLAVLGLADEKVADVVNGASSFGRLVLANHNAPGQVVLSGERPAVDAAAKLAREAGARRTVPLPVSGAFHSPLMRPAAEAFAAAIAAAEIRDPRRPVIANTTALPLRDADAVRDELTRQLTGPVMWSDSVRALCDLGARVFVELGPGAVLTGLVKRTIAGVSAVSAGDPGGIAAAAALIADAAGSNDSPNDDVGGGQRAARSEQ